MFGLVWYRGEMLLKRQMRPYAIPKFMPVIVTWRSYYKARVEAPECFARIDG